VTGAGVGTEPASSTGPPPMWPMATRTRLLAIPWRLICNNTSRCHEVVCKTTTA